MSWNRKYRPQKIADLHLSSVREQLEHLMKEGRIPQTLLFAGPKGTGKTSTARILGALLNDPINQDAVETVFLDLKKSKNPKFQDVSSSLPMIQNILDGNSFIVNEMDAASNRGIDDIRFLKERVSLLPQEGLIAVYILDEAHMLTTEAFNALLKLLEEPPRHVLFILATTELHKIPATIVSRCQVISFKKATNEELHQALSSLVKAEKLSADDNALDAIIKKSDGSFRDAIKMAELSVKDNQISLSALNATIFGNLDSEIEKLIANITSKNSSEVVLQFENFRLQQLDQVFLHKRILELLHQSLMSSLELNSAKEIVSREVAQFLLVHLSDPQLSAYNPMAHLPLELKILAIIDKAQKNNGGSGKAASKEVKKEIKQKTLAEAVVIPKKVMIEDQNLNLKTEAELAILWSDFVNAVKDVSAHAGLLLQSTKFLSSEKNQAKIAVYYKFHQQQLQSDGVIDVLNQVAETFLGSRYQFCFELEERSSSEDLDPKLAAAALM